MSVEWVWNECGMNIEWVSIVCEKSVEWVWNDRVWKECGMSVKLRSSEFDKWSVINLQIRWNPII